MCARDHYFLRQQVRNGDLTYIVMVGRAFHLLDPSGRLTDGSSEVDPDLVGKMVLPVRADTFNPSCDDLKAQRSLFEHLRAEMGKIVPEDDHFDPTLAACFVLLTYVHQCFQSPPHLWLFARSPNESIIAERLFHRYCYNAHTVQSGHDFHATLALLIDFSPTLIFRLIGEDSINRMNYLIYYPNEKERPFPVRGGWLPDAFCPKIIISGKPLPANLSPFIIPVDLEVTGQTFIGMEELHRVRGGIVRLMLNLIPRLQQPLKSTAELMRRDDIGLPLQALLESLSAHGVISPEDRSKSQTRLRALADLASRPRHRSREEDILFGVSQFIDEQMLNDEPIFLDAIIESFQVSGSLRKVTQNQLSRVLKRHNLELDRLRHRHVIKIRNPSRQIQNDNEKVTFRTEVKIDREKLRKLISRQHQQYIKE
ncbi:MAG: hypothetical protein ABSF91_10250 [Bacteroidota bacterium]